MRIILSITLCLFLFGGNLFAQFQIGSDIEGAVHRSFFGTEVVISSDGKRVVIVGFEHVTVYDEIDGNWVLTGDNFTVGWNSINWNLAVALSADGKRLVIGSSFHKKYHFREGLARVFDEINGDWVQVGNDFLGGSQGSSMGRSVDLSSDGNRLAISAGGGKMKIYEEQGGTWNEVGNEIPNYSVLNGNGVSLSADGSFVAIGDHESWITQDLDKVRVYRDNGTVWEQVGATIIGEAIDDDFAEMSLSADGTRLAIGGFRNDANGTDAGHVRVYEYIAGDWVQLGSDLEGNARDGFGYSVSLTPNGNRLLVGTVASSAYLDKDYVRIYDLQNGEWVQFGEDFIIKEGGSVIGAQSALAANGKRLVVGSPFATLNGKKGRASVFSLRGSGGYTFLDNDENCSREIEEVGVRNRTVVINPGNDTLKTSKFGSWYVDSLAVGTYTVTIDTSDEWTTSCPITENFTVTSLNDLTIAPPIGIISEFPCSSPHTNIYMPFIRPCFEDQVIYIQACNILEESDVLTDAYMIIRLDELILPTDFDMPYTDLGNNEYQINLGTLFAGDCVNTNIKAMVDCDAPFGQILCMEVELFPLELCALDNSPNPFPPVVAPCLTPWDNSSLAVSSSCINDSIIFEITNTAGLGLGDMTCFSPVMVYLNGELYLVDSVSLLGGQSETFTFPGSGESWHLQVEQHPYHPGNSHPRGTIENCGGVTDTSLVNIFAQDDANPNIDSYCGEVTGSFDPNDKTGYPIGMGDNNAIQANRQIQYRIRFQNTGTDTAFTVVIRDTLDTDLDITSIRPGISSHSYEFEIYEPRVLEWTFNNIMLPDSNVNESASHGFLLFTVDQVPNLPEGAEINNSAGIYFDFNEPVITNTASHQVTYIIPEPIISSEGSEGGSFKVFPNPSEGFFSIDLKKNYEEVTISVLNVTGQLIREETHQNIRTTLLNFQQESGLYFIRIRTNSGESETFKVLNLR